MYVVDLTSRSMSVRYGTFSVPGSLQLCRCSNRRHSSCPRDRNWRNHSKEYYPKHGQNRCIQIVHVQGLLIRIYLDYIRLSTTVATNALLERKGHKHALLITKGFKDLLLIGNQSRPKIFDLNIRRPPPLYTKVVEVDERVTLVGYTSDPEAEEHAIQFDENGKVKRGYRGKGWDGEGDAEGPGEIVQGISGEAVRILKKPGNYIARLS